MGAQMMHPRLMHPIIDQVGPNEEQLPAVLARGQDVVVTAGAGTGKTRTLVARYLALLAEDVPLRQIVAITFTIKAAQEMRNRIRAELRRYLDQPGLPASERRRWDTLYNELDAGRIGTIHSLCTEILRAHPAEARVDPRFEVLDEGQAGILVNEAIDEALAWAADDEQAVALFALFGEWPLRQILAELMRQRLETQAALAGLPQDLWSLWSAYLIGPLRAFMTDSQVQGAFNELLALRQSGAIVRAAAQGDALAEPLSQLLACWDRAQTALAAEDWPALALELSELKGYLKQVGRKAAWAPADPKAILKGLKEEYDRYLASLLGDGVNLALDRQLAENIPALTALFHQAADFYRRRKDQRQGLDFDDLEDQALRLLREHAAVRERWQTEAAAVLVDEYQDTNGRQRDLVNLLNGGAGKLFIVGDAKQSIYRFRGADVTVFRAERRRIETDGGLGFPLATSYRAHAALVTGLNDLLRPVLGEREDPKRPWWEPFAPLAPFREAAVPGLAGPFIEAQLTVGSKADGALGRAAAALAGEISALVEGTAGQPESTLGYGDVAVLCRSSTSFAAYEDAFDAAGIPYMTVAGRGFFERPEIRDLLNGLRALADPSDDVALVGLLRSPVIGFTDWALYQLCQDWRAQSPNGSLWRALHHQPSEPARRAAELIERLNRRVGRIPVAALLKQFLDESDYRAGLIRAGFPRAARNVSKLLQDAQTSGIVSTGEFLEYIEGLQSGAGREGEARATAGNAVRIMSIHAAKGLEFPIVVIGDITYQRNFRAGLLVDAELGVVPKLADETGRSGALFKLLADRAADQEAAESRRLLYVAATRAQEKLILNGCIRLTQSGKPGYLRGWLKELAEPLGLTEQAVNYNPEGQRVIELALAVGGRPVAGYLYEPKFQPGQSRRAVQEQSAVAETWSPDLLVQVQAGSQAVDENLSLKESDPPRRVWQVIPATARAKAPAWIVGQVVHEALAAWYFPDRPGFEAWVRSRARELGLVDQGRLADATATTIHLLRRFRGHMLFEEMETAERRLAEVPYSLGAGLEAADQGYIDALFLKNGQWTIIEFKSDRLKPGLDLVGWLEDKGYLAQVARYQQAVTRLLGQRPRSLICLLDYGGEIQLVTV